MRTFTILIDMDDTLESLLPPWIKWLNDTYGLNVEVESITDWDINLAFPSLTKEEVFEPLSRREFWLTVLPKPGAVEYVKKLIDDGHHVYICTASHYKGLRDKMELALFKHFPYLKWENVIVAYNKGLIHGDFIVDDAPHNLKDWKGKEHLPLLMDAPHNRDASQTYPFIRVYSWEEIYRRITEAAKCGEPNDEKEPEDKTEVTK